MSQQKFIGYGGIFCTKEDIQKANTVSEALNDPFGWGDDIFAAMSSKSVKFECAPEHIQGPAPQSLPVYQSNPYNESWRQHSRFWQKPNTK